MTPGLCQTLFPTWNYSFIALRKPVVDNLLTQKNNIKVKKEVMMNQKSRTRGNSDFEILRSITSLNLKKIGADCS